MSKVFKETGAFIPEKIVPGEIPQPPVWGPITRKIGGQQGGNSGHSALPNQFQENGRSLEPGVDLTELSSLNSDFSSPDPQDISNEINQSTSDEQVAQINIEEIAEEYFNKGITEGMERVKEDYASSTKTLQSICEELNSIRETILHNSAEEIRNLVMVIAEKIIRQSLSDQQQTIINTVDEALQKAIKSDEFVISVHPDDLETISTRSADFIKSINGLEKVVVRSDSKIEQGGCFIESSNCTVDATIVSQLKCISDSLNK